MRPGLDSAAAAGSDPPGGPATTAPDRAGAAGGAPGAGARRALRWALAAIAVDLGVLFAIRGPAWVEYTWRGLLAAGTLVALVRWGRVPREVLGLSRGAPGSGRWIFRVCLVVLALYLLLGVVAVVGLRATGAHLDLNRYRDFYGVAGMLAWFPHAVILAPILEELLYRAIAVPALAAWFGPRWAIILSGPLFYLLHVAYSRDRWLGFHYLVAGWILAWAFSRRRAVWVAMVLHALGNLLMGLDDVLLIFAGDFVRNLLGG